MQTMEYYLSTRKKEILSFVTTCINLDCIILSEISQIKINIDKYNITYIVEYLSHSNETRIVVTRDWRVGKMGRFC